MAEQKIPKSLSKAASRNTKIIKQYDATKSERIDRIMQNQQNKKKKSQKKKHKPDTPKKVYKPTDSCCITLEDKKERFLSNLSEKEKEHYCSVESFEKSVFLLEGVRIILRGPTYASVPRYPYRKRCSNGTKVCDFVERRIKRIIDSRYQIYVIADQLNPMELTIGDIRKYDEPNS